MESSRILPSIFCILLLIVPTHGQRCIVEEMEVQPNLELERLDGRWYEIQWSSFQFYPEEFLYRDYVNFFEYDPSNMRINVNGSFRRPEASSPCFYYNGFVEESSIPGKLNYTRPLFLENPENSEKNTVPFWIMATDYDNYFVTYGCPTVLANGTCDQSSVKSWIWGRAPVLSQESKSKVKEALERVCMTEDNYLSTSHSGECVIPRSTAWTQSSGVPMVMALSVLVFCIVL